MLGVALRVRARRQATRSADEKTLSWSARSRVADGNSLTRQRYEFADKGSWNGDSAIHLIQLILWPNCRAPNPARYTSAVERNFRHRSRRGKVAFDGQVNALMKRADQGSRTLLYEESDGPPRCRPNVQEIVSPRAMPETCLPR